MGRKVVSAPICANKVRNGPVSVDQGCSTDSQGSRHVHDMSWIMPAQLPLSHLFKTEQIAPTDNVRPKSDNTKMCCQWLKGKPIVHTNSNIADCFPCLWTAECSHTEFSWRCNICHLLLDSSPSTSGYSRVQCTTRSHHILVCAVTICYMNYSWCAAKSIIKYISTVWQS